MFRFRLIKRCRNWLNLNDKSEQKPSNGISNISNFTGFFSKFLSVINLKSHFSIFKSSVACEDDKELNHSKHVGKNTLQNGNESVDADDVVKLPGFSILPVSKGFSITFKKTLDNFASLCDPSSIPSSSSTNTNTTTASLSVD